MKGSLSKNELEQRLLGAGRVNGPAILFDAWCGDEIDASTLASVIGSVWSMAEYPESNIDHEGWRWLFGDAGFTVDGLAAAPPTSIRLYRGCTEDRRDGWAWSSDLDMARRYALGYESGGFIGRLPGRVYTVDAPESALLAHVTTRGESEWVVDTEGLVIVELVEAAS